MTNNHGYVFYPCAGYVGSAVKLFSKDCKYFVYVDHSYSEETINAQIQQRGFRGYRLEKNLKKSDIHDDKLTQLFHASGFVMGCLFRRVRNFGISHGPENFAVFFIKNDAVTTFECLVNSIGAPKAVVYIRPGLSFGGARKSLPNEIDELIIRYHDRGIGYIAHDWGMVSGNPGDMPRCREVFAKLVRSVTCQTDIEDTLNVTIRGKP